MTEKLKMIIAENSNSFKYRLLDRMKADCDYYLGNGEHHSKYLMGGTVKDHIEDMKELYNSFDIEDRPEWITLEEIERYNERMTPGEITYIS